MQDFTTGGFHYLPSTEIRASLLHGTDRTGSDQTQTLIHGTEQNGVERMREAAGLLRLFSQPWPAQHESPVESLTTRVAVFQPRTEKVRDQS